MHTAEGNDLHEVAGSEDQQRSEVCVSKVDLMQTQEWKVQSTAEFPKLHLEMDRTFYIAAGAFQHPTYQLQHNHIRPLLITRHQQ